MSGSRAPRLVVEQRSGRWLVFLRAGESTTRLGGFASKHDAETYAETIAQASPEIVDAAAERGLMAAVAEASIAAQNARHWTDERNRAIVAALEAGATVRGLAEATGLSTAGVSKIGRRAT